MANTDTLTWTRRGAGLHVARPSEDVEFEVRRDHRPGVNFLTAKVTTVGRTGTRTRVLRSACTTVAEGKRACEADHATQLEADAAEEGARAAAPC